MTKINTAQILPIAMILLNTGAAAVLNATISDVLTHAERKPNARER